MAETVESLNCREGHHLSCPRCPCSCHPRNSRGNSEDFAQTGASCAAHWDAPPDDAA